jgi:hypothetical protein
MPSNRSRLNPSCLIYNLDGKRCLSVKPPEFHLQGV